MGAAMSDPSAPIPHAEIIAGRSGLLKGASRRGAMGRRPTSADQPGTSGTLACMGLRNFLSPEGEEHRAKIQYLRTQAPEIPHILPVFPAAKNHLPITPCTPPHTLPIPLHGEDVSARRSDAAAGWSSSG